MSVHVVSTILRCVADRPNGTTCPSEVARTLANDQNSPFKWREYMSMVHESVDALVARGEITLSWKSNVMKKRAGPYRISEHGKMAKSSDYFTTAPLVAHSMVTVNTRGGLRGCRC
ncbi:DUF3253 domain-containing protein [Neorhizobium sp. BT27B]|uniref:DUF3253 domain-containing protein n=1 Tax=Neorhizobium sp. BT27B TaxID=3142625 RepID=UPI003D2A82BE